MKRKAAAKRESDAKKVVSKKISVGRSLKDRSLKRAPLIHRRKVSSNLRSKRHQEESKKILTRNHPQPINIVESRSLRIRTRKSKIEYQEEENIEVDEGSVEKIKKKTIVKKDSDKKLLVDITTEKRIRRSVRDYSIELNSKNLTESEPIKKQTRRTIVEPPVDKIIPVASRTSRRSRSNPNPSEKSIEIKTSLRFRQQESKFQSEIETDMSDETSPIHQTSRKSTNRKDMSKVNKMEEPLVLPRRGKKETKDVLKEVKSSVRIVKTQVKMSKKDYVKTESESKQLHEFKQPPPNQKNTKSNNKKDVKVEVESVAKDSPIRSLRKVASAEKPPTEEVSKNTPTNKETEGLPKRKSEPKLRDDNEDSAKQKLPNKKEGEPVFRGQRNSRNLKGAPVKQVPLNLKKTTPKNLESIEVSPVSTDEDKFSKRITRKKSVFTVEPEESASEEEVPSKVGQIKKSCAKSKSVLETNPMTDQVKTPVEGVGEKPGESSTSLSGFKEDSSRLRPKATVKKKMNLSDDEPLSKEAPSKKLKIIEGEDSLVDESSKAAVLASKKKTDLPETTVKDKRETIRKVIDTKQTSEEIEKKISSKKNSIESEKTVKTLNTATSSVEVVKGSQEVLIDKLEENELKGFDEFTAKETESKVDKFIEHMILKTSDDESNSRMRSRNKQTGGLKEDGGRNRVGRPPSGKNPQTSDPAGLDNRSRPSDSSDKRSIDNTIPNKLQCGPEKSNDKREGRSRRNSANKLKDKSFSSIKSEPLIQIKDEKILDSVKDEPKTFDATVGSGSSDIVPNENYRDGKTKISLPSVAVPVRNTLVDDNSNKNDITSRNKGTVIPGRMSCNSNESDFKIVADNRAAESVKSKVSGSHKDLTDKPLACKAVDVKSKNRGKGRTKRTKESVSDTSDSDDEPKTRIHKKREPPAENKRQPRRGAREFKPKDTCHIPLRASRARVAKHSSSSFYYESDNESQYSSSEEEIPSEKTEPVVIQTVKEDMTTQTDDTKDIVNNDQPQLPETVDPVKSVYSPVCSRQIFNEERKKVDILDDLIDFKSEFDCNDSLDMYSDMKNARQMSREEELSPEDVRSIVKDMKANMPKLNEFASTSSTSGTNLNKFPLPESINVITIDNKVVSCDSRSMLDEATGSIDLLASVAEDISSKMNATQLLQPKVTSSPVTPITDTPASISTKVSSPDKKESDSEVSPLIEEGTPTSSKVKDEIPKPKPKPSSIGETWIQAFKRAKIPKPGQLSPISQSVKPFERKPFINHPFVSRQLSPSKSGSPETKFKPFDRSSLLKSQSLATNNPSKSGHQFKSGNSTMSSIPLVKPLTSCTVKETLGSKMALNVPNSPSISNSDVKKERKIDTILNQPSLAKNAGPSMMCETFRPVDVVKIEDSKPQAIIKTPRPTDVGRRIDLLKDRETLGGKHQNLPLAVEHTLRKMSPVAVSRKPVNTVTLKSQIQPPNPEPKDHNIFDQSKSNRSSPSSCSKSSWLWKNEKYFNDSMVTKPSDLDLMAKKKVNMTVEEIEKWLDDSTSTGIEHSKDCGLFEKNQCECSFRTSGSSMQNSVTVDQCGKVGRSIVEPPMQLKDIEPKCTAETISTCKVEDYKEKLILKSPVNLPKDSKTDSRKDTPGKYKQSTPNKQDKPWKSTRSMTEEEMCEFDFRFERNSNSPRESGSEMSSPTPKDEMSSSNDEGIGSHQSERKSIFHKKSRPLSKSPCAFNAENESSVYAFQPDSDMPVGRPLFRRKTKSGAEEQTGRSTSIAVQVNLEPVLECSTQTDHEEEDGGTTYYIPLGRNNVEQPQQMIQGVTVKLDTDPDGQEHRVTLRAKLVTKAPSDFPRPPPSTSSRLEFYLFCMF